MVRAVFKTVLLLFIQFFDAMFILARDKIHYFVCFCYYFGE